MGKGKSRGFQKRYGGKGAQQARDEETEKGLPSRGFAEEAPSAHGLAGIRWESEPVEPRLGGSELDPKLRVRLNALCEEGWDLWERFDIQVRQQSFHPFVAADYPVVLEALISLREPGLKFLEWGSATGVITIMADLLGFDAYGIEIDRDLVDQARDLARRTGSNARFTAGSFLPTGYRWKNRGDDRLGTIGYGDSGYLELGMPLEDFDLVFGYPWAGEEPMMHDLMRVYGRADARLLVQTGSGIKIYNAGRAAPCPSRG